MPPSQPSKLQNAFFCASPECPCLMGTFAGRKCSIGESCKVQGIHQHEVRIIRSTFVNKDMDVARDHLREPNCMRHTSRSITLHFLPALRPINAWSPSTVHLEISRLDPGDEGGITSKGCTSIPHKWGHQSAHEFLLITSSAQVSTISFMAAKASADTESCISPNMCPGACLRHDSSESS